MRMERKEAREEGREERENEIAVAMLKNILSVKVISKVCGLSEAAILKLAASNNLNV